MNVDIIFLLDFRIKKIFKHVFLMQKINMIRKWELSWLWRIVYREGNNSCCGGKCTAVGTVAVE
jgi:hypothetical protein